MLGPCPQCGLEKRRKKFLPSDPMCSSNTDADYQIIKPLCNQQTKKQRDNTILIRRVHCWCHFIPSTTSMASMKNWRYASRSPVRSKDKRDPTVSKITPCRDLKHNMLFSIRKVIKIKMKIKIKIKQLNMNCKWKRKREIRTSNNINCKRKRKREIRTSSKKISNKHFNS